MARGELPFLKFSNIELHLDEKCDAQDLYEDVKGPKHEHPVSGTKIWVLRKKEDGAFVVVKEFYRADPEDYRRDLPDPAWDIASLPSKPRGANRGLHFKRLEFFDSFFLNSSKAISESDPRFLDQFNIYSFEVEALITQLVRYYGYDRIVQATRWGPIRFSEGYRFAIEMERLETLYPSTSHLEIIDDLINMMLAVSQLHSMVIPIRAFPPELTVNIEEARKTPLVRPYHYDLAPEQFLSRPATSSSPSTIVLLDFNSVRPSLKQLSSFTAATTLGRYFFQAPDRRFPSSLNKSEFFLKSSPIYDLFSLMIISLFYILRDSEKTARELWKDYEKFYVDLAKGKLLEDALHKLQPFNKGVDWAPWEKIFRAIQLPSLEERQKALVQIEQLNWKEDDWMLVPRVMDFFARHTLGRTFSIVWFKSHIICEEGSQSYPLSNYIQSLEWQCGSSENERIEFPDFKNENLFFFQKETAAPKVRNGWIDTTSVGRATIFASFGGCVDFKHPLIIEIRPRFSATKSPTQRKPPSSTQRKPSTFENSNEKIDNSEPVKKEKISSETKADLHKKLHNQQNTTNKDIVISAFETIELATKGARISDDIGLLEVLEKKVEEHRSIPEHRLALLNIYVRQAQLEFEQGILTFYSPSLKKMAKLFDELNQPSLNFERGYLLNNLTIFLYQLAYREEKLENWKRIFRFDPLKELHLWYSKMKKVYSSESPPPLMEDLLARVEETIRYAQLIHKKLK